MSLTEFPELEQGSDAWLEQRRGLVTASVVGKLITAKTRHAIDYGCTDCFALAAESCIGKRGEPIKTMHPARAEAARSDTTPPPLVPASNDDSRALTAQLVAERITGYVDPTYMNDDMWRGVEDEPRARDLYSEKYAPVRESGFLIRREPTWTLGYSPDGLVGDVGLIEVKSPRAKTHLRTILADEVPPHHMAQCQAGLLVSGREWLDFISYSGGMPMWVRRVEPDQRWFDAISTAVEMFEQTAAQMVAAYEKAIKGLAPTERVIEQEMVI